MASTPDMVNIPFLEQEQGLLSQLNAMRLQHQLCDVTVRAGEQEFHCHQAVLAASSGHFHSIFVQGVLCFPKKPSNESLDLSFVSPEVFTIILDFIYTANLKCPAEIVGDVLQAAKMLEIPPLIKQLPVFVAGSMNSNKVQRLSVDTPQPASSRQTCSTAPSGVAVPDSLTEMLMEPDGSADQTASTSALGNVVVKQGVCGTSHRTGLGEHESRSLRIRAAVNSRCQQGRTPQKQRKNTSRVPDRCRDDVRKMYKALLEDDNDFDGFNLTETVDSLENRQVVQTIQLEIIRDYGGEHKCPFAPKEVRDAARRYYRSQRDDRVRREKGHLTTHRMAMRKAQQLTQKVQRRRRALEKCQDHWSARTKKRAEEILTKDYQSSESSGDDEYQDPPTFTIRRLYWESEAMRKLKDSLDGVCPQRGAPRVLSDKFSSRTVPDGAPAWAVQKTKQEELVHE